MVERLSCKKLLKKFHQNYQENKRSWVQFPPRAKDLVARSGEDKSESHSRSTNLHKTCPSDSPKFIQYWIINAFIRIANNGSSTNFTVKL